MKPHRSLIFAIVLLWSSIFDVAEMAKLKFTNLQCIEFDRPFAAFKKCFLKAIARDTTSLNVHAQLFKLPLTNVTVHAQLFQKGNGYRPVLYNDTGDFCQFLINPRRYLFWNIVYRGIRPYTNVNHSCPIDHDIIVDNLTMNADLMKMIPFPASEYMIQLQFAAYNQNRAKVKIYIQLYV